MNSCNLAIVGATGAVGREMIKVLEDRDVAFDNLRLFATERSAGTIMECKGEEYEVEVTNVEAFSDVDIALFSAGSSASKNLAPKLAKQGVTVIDNSSAFRMDPEVPLVVPEVNPDALEEHGGIIANPNCSTIQMVMALKPLYDKVGIKRLVIATYQAVSGTGKKAIDELEEQSKEVLAGKEAQKEVYPEQIAFNALPHIDVFFDNLYTKEEMKLVNETKKILSDDSLKITSTAVRIPVFTGHAEAVNIETEEKITVEETRKLLSDFSGVEVVDQPKDLKYPTQLDTEENDNVLVGRIREDESIDKGLNIWVVANNLRKGAALNTVQIAELLLKK